MKLIRHVERFVIGLVTLAAVLGLVVAVTLVGHYFIHAVLPPKAIEWARWGMVIACLVGLAFYLVKGIYEAGKLWEK